MYTLRPQAECKHCVFQTHTDKKENKFKTGSGKSDGLCVLEVRGSILAEINDSVYFTIRNFKYIHLEMESSGRGGSENGSHFTIPCLPSSFESQFKGLPLT